MNITKNTINYNKKTAPETRAAFFRMGCELTHDRIQKNDKNPNENNCHHGRDQRMLVGKNIQPTGLFLVAVNLGKVNSFVHFLPPWCRKDIVRNLSILAHFD